VLTAKRSVGKLKLLMRSTGNNWMFLFKCGLCFLGLDHKSIDGDVIKCTALEDCEAGEFNTLGIEVERLDSLILRSSLKASLLSKNL
jgi:hypothetical protein